MQPFNTSYPHWFIRPFILLMLMAVLLLAEAGKFSAVKGNVSILRGTETLKAKAGMVIQEKDTIESAADSLAQVLFSDGTTVSVGPKSSFSVEEFVYDDKTGKGDAKFNMGNGFFRTITGKIGKASPDRFKMATKTATIGIRGTNLAFNSADGATTLNSIPGQNEGTGILGNDVGNTDVPPGTQSVAQPGVPPTPPVQIPTDQLNNIQSFDNQVATVVETQAPQVDQAGEGDAQQGEGDQQGEGEGDAQQQEEGQAQEGEGDQQATEGDAQQGEGDQQATEEGAAPQEGEQTAEGDAPAGEEGAPGAEGEGAPVTDEGTAPEGEGGDLAVGSGADEGGLGGDGAPTADAGDAGGLAPDGDAPTGDIAAEGPVLAQADPVDTGGGFDDLGGGGFEDPAGGGFGDPFDGGGFDDTLGGGVFDDPAGGGLGDPLGGGFDDPIGGGLPDGPDIPDVPDIDNIAENVAQGENAPNEEEILQDIADELGLDPDTLSGQLELFEQGGGDPTQFFGDGGFFDPDNPNGDLPPDDGIGNNDPIIDGEDDFSNPAISLTGLDVTNLGTTSLSNGIQVTNFGPSGFGSNFALFSSPYQAYHGYRDDLAFYLNEIQYDATFSDSSSSVYEQFFITPFSYSSFTNHFDSFNHTPVESDYASYVTPFYSSSSASLSSHFLSTAYLDSDEYEFFTATSGYDGFYTVSENLFEGFSGPYDVSIPNPTGSGTIDISADFFETESRILMDSRKEVIVSITEEEFEVNGDEYRYIDFLIAGPKTPYSYVSGLTGWGTYLDPADLPYASDRAFISNTDDVLSTFSSLGYKGSLVFVNYDNYTFISYDLPISEDDDNFNIIYGKINPSSGNAKLDISMLSMDSIFSTNSINYGTGNGYVFGSEGQAFGGYVSSQYAAATSSSTQMGAGFGFKTGTGDTGTTSGTLDIEGYFTLNHTGSITMADHGLIYIDIYKPSSSFTTPTSVINKMQFYDSAWNSTSKYITIEGDATGTTPTGVYITDDTFASFKLGGTDIDDGNAYDILSSDQSFLIAFDDGDTGSDYVSWGYWGAEMDNGSATNQFIIPTSVWVAGQKSSASTIPDGTFNSTDDLVAMVNQLNPPTTCNTTTCVVEYQGKVIGGTVVNNNVYQILQDTTNKADFQFDFGLSNPLSSVTINFNDSGGHNWTNSLSTSTSTYSEIKADLTGTGPGGSSSAKINGSYYGPNVDAVAGIFEISDSSSNVANGVFKSKR